MCQQQNQWLQHKNEKTVLHQYNTSHFFKCLKEFACMTNGPSINAFLKNKEKISKSSFLCYYHKGGLAEYKNRVHLMQE